MAEKAEKVTKMKLKVDLECHKCTKKVKKLLAKYPQIRDESFDEKQNIVTITVVCCSPEKIRDKLCYKGGGSIKSIEIVEPPKPKPADPEKKKDAGDKPKPPAADPDKKKDAAAADKPKPKPAAAEPDKKKDGGDKPKDAAPPKDKGDKPKADAEKPKEKPTPPPVKIVDPMAAYPPAPQPMMVPVGVCVTGYEAGPVGPCVNGYAGPVMCYDGYYARPVYDSYGGGRPYYVNRCDQYFSDENPAGCTVM